MLIYRARLDRRYDRIARIVATMKALNILGGAALLVNTEAHYIFGRFIYNHQTTKTWEYIREVSPRPESDRDLALFWPLTDPTSTDLRCGRNASLGWSQPKTAVINAGDTVGFAAGEPKTSIVQPGAYHPGFAGVWMSRSTVESLDGYAGDGDWFKILQITGRTEQSIDFSLPGNASRMDRSKTVWGTYLIESWNFTIPATTPPGLYLIRWEHIFPNVYDAQFYVNCAHVQVVNDGPIGTPGPTVKIPGVYTRGQKDVYFSSYDYGVPGSLDGFIPPKPEVWKG
ncbi:lytic polysaccharide monooxygenase [Lentithecium fluviatile CBS 122367]|uniref:lytic cellulose monooxygenase (C4-dehydrogenating) n=1 Tax=Lentithecium fluviatile CBS 122367 TaxID=1168545 RepID=A0A6G1JBA3_9PLEO|nr:lytic polysaccharide monooxygenase [Lentithecium fluviatile CBS 122367]